MKHLPALAFAATLITGSAFAQERHDHPVTGPSMSGPSMSGPSMKGPAAKTEWRKGSIVPIADWNRGHKVEDVREHKLDAAPAGQEWRHIDDKFVLATSDTHLISVVLEAHH